MTSVIIGNFDGVHAGHQKLIEAARLHGDVTAITFYPHPAFILTPERMPSQLLPLEDRIALLKHHGVSHVEVIEFTEEFAALSPDAFINDVLCKRVGATHVTVGKNFTFGYKAAGNAQYLKDHAEGMQVEILDLEASRGGAISSTRIRQLIIDGEMERASELLTRSHFLVGPIVHGDARGRTIGYPTANFSLHELATLPADGVYAGWLSCEGERWKSAVSIGTNPTFPGVRGRRVEAYALDRDDLNLYDKLAKVEFVTRLRDTTKFDGLDELLAQIAKDCDQVRALLP